MDKIKLILLIISTACLGKIIPHTPNVSPLISLAIVAGLYLPRSLGVGIILSSNILGDLILVILGKAPCLGYWAIFTNSALVMIALGLNYLKNFKLIIIGLGFFSSICWFWLWTNFGVWLCSGFYLHNFNGLVKCYIAALPFLKNNIVGELCWSIIIYGILVRINGNCKYTLLHSS